MIIKNDISKNFEELRFRNNIQIVRIRDFDDDLVRKVEKKVSKAHENEQPVIPFVIDSNGGSVFSLMSIYETIQSSEIPVLTYLKGKALSAGIITLGFGTKGYRFSSPHGTGMMHEITWGKRDKLSEVEEQVEHARQQNNYIFKQLAKHVGLEEDYYLDLMYDKDQRNADKWMTPEELKDHSLIDSIGSPSLTRKAEVKWEFDKDK